MKKLLATLSFATALTLCVPLAACDLDLTLTTPDTSDEITELDGSTPSEGLEFTLLSDDTYAFSGLGTCTDENVVIPATYEGKAVTKVGAYIGVISMAEVYPDLIYTDDDGYLAVDINVYYQATSELQTLFQLQNVKTVYIPDGVVSIGDFAFAYCLTLEQVRLPDTLEEMGDSTFLWCKNLKTVSLPNSLTDISYQAFQDCSSLKTVTLGENVSIIYDQAFQRCVNLTSVNLGDSLKYIGTDAFSRCVSLTEIYLGTSLETIEKNAFETCVQVTKLTIPQNVKKIGEGAFDECYSLASVTWDAENAEITFEDYAYENPGYCIFGLSWGLKEVIVGEHVKVLPADLFYGCYTIETLTLPATLEEIGDECFYGCIALLSVDVPSSTVLGEDCFSTRTTVNLV